MTLPESGFADNGLGSCGGGREVGAVRVEKTFGILRQDEFAKKCKQIIRLWFRTEIMGGYMERWFLPKATTNNDISTKLKQRQEKIQKEIGRQSNCHLWLEQARGLMHSWDSICCPPVFYTSLYHLHNQKTRIPKIVHPLCPRTW